MNLPKFDEKTASIDAYLAHLREVRRLAKLTCKSYERDLALLNQLSADTPFHGLRVHDIRHFIAQLHGSGLSGKSLARTLSAWRTFFQYLIRFHSYQNNPCQGIKVPKSPKYLPHTLSPDEAAKLMDFENTDELSARDLAMFELFYSSGLRLQELVQLKPHDIDFSEGQVRVIGKGEKTRIVPVGHYALEALKIWLNQRETLARINSDALFVSSRGNRIHPRTIQQRLKVRADQQQLQSKVHPHSLRHSFASHVLQSSGDLRAVQEMLGHASISTTQVYTHLDFQHLAKIYDHAHPRAKRKKISPSSD
ncbi:MAG: tyrosine recombinase XerC [Nitrosomonas sp.]|jgi:integrase/recombinase XerC|nr:tyrosine recombinase XerC [Nitrosomonas sp.]MBK7365902.1 tyrosine recombinase XerC [Nitrosomonas sp.]